MKGKQSKKNLTAAFLFCTAVVYACILGTQFKLMSFIPHGHDPKNSIVARSLAQSNSDRPNKAKRIVDLNLRKRPRGASMAELVAKKKIAVDRKDQNIDRGSPLLDEGKHAELYHSLSASIAQKWNLTTPSAVELLERQFRKENDYDPQRDFFHFHHLYKSGGTSISGLMDKTVGLPKVGETYVGILPGSHESGDFDHEKALDDINRRIAHGKIDRKDLPYRASYAHTGLRPMYGPKATKTGAFFLKQLPHKRFRMVTMLREPTDFRASNHAMIMCGLNYEVSRFNNERAANGLARTCSPQDGLNISALVDRKIEDLMEKCKTKPDKINAQQRKQCEGVRNGIDPWPQCRSAADLLKHKQYDRHYRSMFKALMGRFHRRQEFNNNTSYGRMGYGFESAEGSRGYSVEAVEAYTLEDLGGLDLSISGAGTNGPPEPDFIWFGITERMKESTALFHYYFKAAPAKTPIHRIQDCRPTSWWTEEDRKVVKDREPADYAVWRAANAILDVRMEKMKMEIQSLLSSGETRESLYWVDWDTLETVGVRLDNNLLIM